MAISRHHWIIGITATLAIAVAGTLTVLRVDAGTPPPAEATPLAAVDVAPVVAKTITDWHTYSGRLQAVDRVEIRPLVSGTITAVHFQDGSLVKKGDVLFTIDPRPYAAEVERARAQLAAARARTAYTKTELARAERLLADNAIARRDFDEKQNAAREAAANLQAAEAALDTANLNLGYTQVRAPVSGRVSRAEITVGNVVSAGAGSTPLTTLVSVSPIYASFDMDEQSFLKYIGTNGTAANAKVPVFLGLGDESGYPREGAVHSIDNRLDTASGTIRVRAVFANPDGRLIPGLYARIKLGGGAPHPAVLISDKAIGTDQDKQYVLVVDASGHAQYRQVVLGNVHDGLRVIEHGLGAGDRIVVNGLQRVRPGERVAPRLVSMLTGEPLAPTASAQAANGSRGHASGQQS